MKPLGWTLLLIGLCLLVFAVTIQLGMVMPWGERLGPSPILVGLVGLLVLAAGYCAMRLSRR